MGSIRDQREINARSVRRAYAAHGRGDLDGFLAPFDPQVEWEQPSRSGTSPRRLVGRESVADLVFGTISARYERFAMDLHEAVADESGRVVALGNYSAGRSGADTVEASFAHVWRFRGGRVVRFRDFHDQAERMDLLERQISEAIAETTLSLSAALSAKDSYTAEHGSCVAELACAVAARLGLGADAAEAVRQAALLHDIGKIAVPDSILHKPGPLTEAEWEVMKRHPEIGEGIIAPLSCMRATREIVRHDHERWDGGGYPDGLAGEMIPLGARIIFAVDAFHAMTSTRPYREAMSEADARAELLRGAGTQFDPAAVDALLDVLDAAPAALRPARAA